MARNRLPNTEAIGDLNRNVNGLNEVKNFLATVLAAQPGVSSLCGTALEKLWSLSDRVSCLDAIEPQVSAKTVDFLLSTKQCDAALLNSLESVISKIGDAPNFLEARVLRQLVDLIPWDEMKRRREKIKQEGDALLEPSVRDAKDATASALKDFAWDKAESERRRACGSGGFGEGAVWRRTASALRRTTDQTARSSGCA